MNREGTRHRSTDYQPAEHSGRPQLTQEGYALIESYIDDIEGRRLPELRPLLIVAERDERDVAEFERLLGEVDRLRGLLGSADIIAFDPDRLDGRIDIGMRVRVRLADGSDTWVRPVHPDESFLDDERISALSPLALALVGARRGQTVWVSAPSGVWACEVLDVEVSATGA